MQEAKKAKLLELEKRHAVDESKNTFSPAIIKKIGEPQQKASEVKRSQKLFIERSQTHLTAKYQKHAAQKEKEDKEKEIHTYKPDSNKMSHKIHSKLHANTNVFQRLDKKY